MANVKNRYLTQTNLLGTTQGRKHYKTLDEVCITSQTQKKKYKPDNANCFVNAKNTTRTRIRSPAFIA